MIIHVVEPGDSVYTLSRRYRVPVETIMRDNAINDPQKLVIGEALVLQPGASSHRVQRGESLFRIARKYGISVAELMAANPGMRGPGIDIGMVLTIPAKTGKLGTIEVNGYGFPNMDMDLLRETLPYLTFLSVFSYLVSADGSINNIPDEPLIRAALSARVSPMMVITNIEEGKGFSSEIARSVLTSPAAQDRLLDSVIRVMQTKGYRGLDIDFEYIFPANRQDYNNFIRKAAARLRPMGYYLASALAPKTSADQPGLLYEAHDYPVHGSVMDHVILMTYEWGYTYGDPQPVAPLNEVRKVISYAVTAIPRNKILMGIPNYGYDWTLPHKQGDAAKSLSNTGAVDLAARVGAHIQYDAKAQSPFFNYYDSTGVQHIVWFEDARSIRAKLLLAHEYRLQGVSYWTITRPFPQNWIVLSSLFHIRKVEGET